MGGDYACLWSKGEGDGVEGEGGWVVGESTIKLIGQFNIMGIFHERNEICINMLNYVDIIPFSIHLSLM